MSARAGLRLLSQSSRQAAFRAPVRATRQNAFRRYQSTTTTAAAPVADAAAQNIFQKIWTSEVGVKTVHFWAPVMKWAVVLAGAADFFRPPEKLSLSQNLALTATGTIWTRWCFVIRPKNMLLAAVNFCLAIVGTIQVSRILMWQRSQEGSTTGALKEMGSDLKSTAQDVKVQAEKAAP